MAGFINREFFLPEQFLVYNFIWKKSGVLGPTTELQPKVYKHAETGLSSSAGFCVCVYQYIFIHKPIGNYF